MKISYADSKSEKYKIENAPRHYYKSLNEYYDKIDNN